MFNVCKRQWEWLVIPQLALRRYRIWANHTCVKQALTIKHRKFGIQEDKLMLFLDTKFTPSKCLKVTGFPKLGHIPTP